MERPGTMWKRAPVLAMISLWVLQPDVATLSAQDSAGVLSAGKRAGEILDPRLDAVVSVTGEEGRGDAILVLWNEVRVVAEEEMDLATRRLILAALESRLRSRLVDAYGAAENAGDTAALVTRALARAKERRRIDLLGRLLCSCKNENWSRTLLVCWEPCRNYQVELVRSWLDEGASDREVIERMVAEIGTTRVIMKPRGVLSKLTPYFFAAGGLVFVLFVLRSTLRKRGGAFDSAAGEITGETAGRNMRETEAAGEASPDEAALKMSGRADAELETRLDEELRELED